MDDRQPNPDLPSGITPGPVNATSSQPASGSSQHGAHDAGVKAKPYRVGLRPRH
jgi:hypothetical protein